MDYMAWCTHCGHVILTCGSSCMRYTNPLPSSPSRALLGTRMSSKNNSAVS